MALKYVAAYLLAILGGKDSPSEADVKKILGSVGVETEDAILSSLIKNVKGKPTHELIAEGMKKLQAVPSGGGGGGAVAAAAPAAKGGDAPPAAGKKEEKKEEKEEEEEDEDMGFSLFD